jgi:hypothetical protein
MDIEELKIKIHSDIEDYLVSFKNDIFNIIDNNLSDYIEDKKSNMILDIDNFIFEMNKENNLLTVALKEFIEYYIKYKQ